MITKITRRNVCGDFNTHCTSEYDVESVTKFSISEDNFTLLYRLLKLDTLVYFKGIVDSFLREKLLKESVTCTFLLGEKSIKKLQIIDSTVRLVFLQYFKHLLRTYHLDGRCLQ